LRAKTQANSAPTANTYTARACEVSILSLLKIKRKIVTIFSKQEQHKNATPLKKSNNDIYRENIFET